VADSALPDLVAIGKVTDTRPGGRTAMTVYVAGRVLYSRTSPDPNAFNVEVAFWSFAPITVAILAGALLGTLAAYVLSQWLFRRNAPSVGTLLF
jgi:hypothetical protein